MVTLHQFLVKAHLFSAVNQLVTDLCCSFLIQ